MTDTPSLFYESYSIADRYEPEASIVVAPGDCVETLKTIPDGSIKLVVTSPPYNIGKEYEEKFEALEEYAASLKPLLDEIARVVSPSGSVCWQVGNYVEEGEIVPLDVMAFWWFRSRGLKLRNRIIWHFEHGLHATNRFSGRYETLLWFTRSDDYTFNLDPVRVAAKYPGKTHYKGEKRGQPSGNPAGKNPSDFWALRVEEWATGIWEIPNVKANHPEKTNHPCQFPIELVERCVLALTDEDDAVLDPFAGSGSALLAALRHNRRAIGCEKEANYIEIIKGRIAAFYNGTLPYRPLGKPVHVPSGRVAQRPKEWSNNEEKD